MQRRSENQQINQLQLAQRRVIVSGGPASFPKGSLSEPGLIQKLSELFEIRAGSRPRNYFVIVSSPARNGNTKFLGKLGSEVGRGRAVQKIQMPSTGGKWSALQYPRILEALSPEYRRSKRYRQKFHDRFKPLHLRILLRLGDLLVPITVFILTNIFFGRLVGTVSRESAFTINAAWRAAADLPIWVYLSSILVASASFYLVHEWQRIRRQFGVEDDSADFHLAAPNRDFLQGDNKSFLPIRRLFEERTRNLPTLVTVDRADEFDKFSADGLMRCLLDDERDQVTNRIIVLHFSNKEHYLFTKLRIYYKDHARPEDYFLEVELEPVALADRIEIARALGKSDDDARQTRLIADLVQKDEPGRLAIRNWYCDQAREEFETDSGLGPAGLLTVLACSGFDGSPQFSYSDLRHIVTRQDSTLFRWLKIFGKTVPSKGELDNLLEHLENVLDVKLVTRQATQGRGLEYRVPREIRKIILAAIAEEATWLRTVHGFWAAYLGERAITRNSPRGVDDLVELSWQLSRLFFPDASEIVDLDAASKFAETIVLIAKDGISELLHLAQFDRAHVAISRLTKDVVRRTEFWESEGFVRQVGSLSSEIWRLATVRGVSEDILSFQKLVSSRSGKGGLSGIEASVRIFEVYHEAIQLQAVDRQEVLALRVTGGSEGSRALLENLRAYAINVSLLHKHCLVLECPEELPSAFEEVGGLVLAQIRDAQESPELDLFEYLVRIQRCRVLLAFRNLGAGIAELEILALRLSDAFEKLRDEDLLEVALWYLLWAETQLVVLECYWLGGDDLFIQGSILAPVLLEIYGASILKREVSRHELRDRLIENVKDALDDAAILQEICKVSIGRACLLNAYIRYCSLLPVVNSDRGCRGDLWKQAAELAREIGCEHLYLGSIFVRSQVRDDLEVCTSCLKIVCQEAIRSHLVVPARVLGPKFSSLAVVAGDERLYRFANEVLEWIGDTIDPSLEDSGLALLQYRCKVERAQFYRLLGEQKACLDVLGEIPEGEEGRLEGEVELRTFRDICLSKRLQICWCLEELKDEDGLQNELERAFGGEDIGSYGGFPHFLRIKLSLLSRLGQLSEDSLRWLVRALYTHGGIRKFDRRGLLYFCTGVLRESRGLEVGGDLRGEIVGLASDLVLGVSEWDGLELNVLFLREAVQYEELSKLGVERLYQEMFAREAVLGERLSQLDQQLTEGTMRPLITYLLNRFEHRIEWFGDREATALRLKEQLGKSGPGSFSEAQVKTLVEMAQNMEMHGQKVELDLHLRVLVDLSVALDSWRDPGYAIVVSTGLRRATVEFLRLVAASSWLSARLAEAMTVYLRICDAFERDSAE